MLRDAPYTDATMDATTETSVAAVTRLHRDHERFRKTLHALEAALKAGTAGHRVRACCEGLLKQLVAHMRREEPLTAAGPGSGHATVTHEEDQRRLKLLLSACFMEGPQPDFERHQARLNAMIGAFRAQMERQEQELFPRCECAPHAHPGHGRLCGATTVQHVISQHPETKSLLECLFVSLPDGPDPVDLDEVAYRRGMDTEELICRLQDTLVN